MSRTILIGLVALPVFLCNAASSEASNSSVPIFGNNFLPKTALIASSIKVQLIQHIMPFQLSARDDQTEDCLRAGNCKD